VHLRNLTLQTGDATSDKPNQTYGSAGDVRPLCETLMVCKRVDKKYQNRLAEEENDAESEAYQKEPNAAAEGGDEKRQQSQTMEDMTGKENRGNNQINAKDACVTIVDMEIPYYTPIHHMKLPYTPCPGKFQVRAKIRSVFPTDLKRWTRPFCDVCKSSENVKKKSSKGGSKYRCDACGRKGRVSFQYFFTLTLADATGDQEVIVAFDEATYFLNGLPVISPPEERYRSPSHAVVCLS